MKPNKEQQAVIDSAANQIVCIAGPGSGKTATLCARILRLIMDGADPASMIIITFTNAAGDELKARLKENINLGPRPPFGYIGTLHGFLLRLITAQHHLAGLPATLSVMDADQKQGLVETLLAELNCKTSLKAFLPLLERRDLIESGKGANRSRDELAAIEFHRRLRQSGLLDFDSILYYGLKLIRALDGWSYRYLFVDEFQDSADIDAQIYEAMPCANKFLVGDPDQAIYSFRGGNVGNILKLAVDHPLKPGEWKTFTLQTNYRSGHIICGAANWLINENKTRFHKSTIASREGGQIEVASHKVAANELGWLLDEIQALVAGDADALRRPDDIAVLCRTNALVKDIADFLESHGLPIARRKYIEKPQDWPLAKMLLTVMANPFNDLAVYQFIAAHLTKKSADQMKLAAAQQMQPLIKLSGLKFPGAEDVAGTIALSLSSAGISASSRERIHDAARILSGEGEWTINQLILVLNGAEGREEMSAGISCKTIHGSKGLEWDTVFIAGAEQGTIPNSRKDTDLEEERRLFYVAITRAKQNLFVSHCQNRPLPFQRNAIKACLPSQFIGEAKL